METYLTFIKCQLNDEAPVIVKCYPWDQQAYTGYSIQQDICIGLLNAFFNILNVGRELDTARQIYRLGLFIDANNLVCFDSTTLRQYIIENVEDLQKNYEAFQQKIQQADIATLNAMPDLIQAGVTVSDHATLTISKMSDTEYKNTLSTLINKRPEISRDIDGYETIKAMLINTNSGLEKQGFSKPVYDPKSETITFFSHGLFVQKNPSPL